MTKTISFDPEKEELLRENVQRFTLFPIKYQDIWELYKKALGSFWTVDEIDFGGDIQHFKEKLNDDERYFIKNILAFFAGSDGIVNENLAINFYNEIQIPEVRNLYATQIQIESIHGECVAPETKILTDKGYITIKEYENEYVNVWNGKEWSNNILIKKTGQNRKLLKVVLSNGIELYCTENHKWHIRKGNQRHPETCKNEVIETKELVKNDIIITKWDYPIIKDLEDPDLFLNPYTHGFFCGDGSYCNKYPILTLYFKGNKTHLLKYLNVSSVSYSKEKNIKCYLTRHINKDKFYVPVNYSIETKLRWLEGIIDANGTKILNPKKNCNSIQLSSINMKFLRDIQLMLSTISIQSNIKKNYNTRTKLLPSNSSKNNFQYKECYVLYISCYNTVKLYNLGLRPKRVTLDIINQQIKQQKGLVKIVDIIDENRIDDTFCFTEPKNNTGIFNGILTGQCYSVMIDTYIDDPQEKLHLFNAIETIPVIKKKANWALKWITQGSFPERLLAFAVVEGVFFSGSFCAIYWLKSRGLMPGLSMANQFISRDEALHTETAVVLYLKLNQRLPEEQVHELFREAYFIEQEFITESLPVSLIGMNSELMKDYIKFVIDYWLTALKYNKLYNVKNPFSFMEYISIENKTNFFEKRVSEYSKANVGTSALDNSFSLTEDF